MLEREYDEAVAKAVGLEPKNGRVSCFVSGPERHGGPNLCAVPFRPSSDLNDAFWALEKATNDPAGTFWRNDSDGRWGVDIQCKKGLGATLALAICDLILQLKPPRKVFRVQDGPMSSGTHEVYYQQGDTRFIVATFYRHNSHEQAEAHAKRLNEKEQTDG